MLTPTKCPASFFAIGVLVVRGACHPAVILGYTVRPSRKTHVLRASQPIPKGYLA